MLFFSHFDNYKEEKSYIKAQISLFIRNDLFSLNFQFGNNIFYLFIQLFKCSIVIKYVVCEFHTFSDILFVWIFIVHFYFFMMLEFFE